jgi:hypothetical protein
MFGQVFFFRFARKFRMKAWRWISLALAEGMAFVRVLQVRATPTAISIGDQRRLAVSFVLRGFGGPSGCWGRIKTRFPPENPLGNYPTRFGGPLGPPRVHPHNLWGRNWGGRPAWGFGVVLVWPRIFQGSVVLFGS